MKKTDFLIVGNGLAGTMLAFEMLKNNLDFRIISSPVKSRATEVAAGMFNPLVFKRLTKSWMADELLPVMKEKYSELEQLLGQKFYFEKDIIKPLSVQEEQWWTEKRTKPEFSKYIVSVHKKAPVKELVAATAYGRVTGSGYLNLYRFLKAADEFFTKQNLLLKTTFGFDDFNPLNPETRNASKIIFCEGAYLAENPFFNFIKLVPTKGEILLVYIPGLPEDFILNKRIFVLPVGKQKFKTGSTYNWDYTSEQPTEAGKLFLTEQLGKIISCQFSVENHWAGIRPATSDRRPVLGIHPVYGNLSVFNGLGTKGVMLAPYFAGEMLKLLTQNGYSVPTEASLERYTSA